MFNKYIKLSTKTSEKDTFVKNSSLEQVLNLILVEIGKLNHRVGQVNNKNAMIMREIK